MSRNPALELLRNPKPYPHATNGSTPPRTKQPNRAADELRKPQQPYPQPGPPSQRPPQGGRQPPPNASQPRASQPRQGPPNASQPRPGQNPLNSLRNPQPYPTASQPQSRPRTPQSTGSSRPVTPQSYATPAYSPPSASQPRTTPAPVQGRPGGVPQKKKPRVAVSMGAPKPYQPPRQATQHVTPPVRTRPPTASQPPPNASQPRASQPRQGPPNASQSRPGQNPVNNFRNPQPYPTATASQPPPNASQPTQRYQPQYATPSPVSPSPAQVTPVVTTHPPSPQHSDITPTRYEPVHQEHQPTYRNPPPSFIEPTPPVANSRLTPTSGYDESDVPDDRDSKRSFGNDVPSPESDIESFGGSERTPSPLPEKKMIEDEPAVQVKPVKQKSTSKLHLAPQDKGSDRRKVYVRRMAIIFIVLLVFALALGLGLSSRGVNFSGLFAMNLNKPCEMVCENPSKNGYSQRAVLMIALDGFRPEFLNDSWRDIIPNIHRLAECGVVATNVEPSYPSTTYPNLYTLITGLFPSVHGIVGDYMTRDGIAGAFDPRNNPQSPSLEDPAWYRGKSIWQTAKEQGIVTGSHSWLGNNVRDYSESGVTVFPKPDYYVEHNPSIDFRARIQSALNWFTLPSNKAKFVNIFMEEPGNTIRRHGVTANQIEEALAEVDNAIGLFMDNLVNDDATNCFDIVLVSTNGHLDVSCGNTTYFDDILSNTLFYDTTSHMNSLAFLTPTSSSPTDSDTPEELVGKIGCNKGPFKTYTTDTVPPKYQLSNGERHEAAVVIMDDWQTFAGSSTGFDNDKCRGARGGYSTMNPEMKGMLLGFGPSFRHNRTFTEGFQNIEVYNLISELIDVFPEENNGTHGSLNHLLRSPGMSLIDFIRNEKNVSVFEAESGMCTYPSNAAIINQKRSDADTGCQCPGKTQQELDNKDTLLDISEGEGDILIREDHAPFGAPKVVKVHGAVGGHHCKLFQDNYVTVFENKLSIPLYIAFTANRGTPSFDNLENCNRYDVRLEPEVSPKCSDYTFANSALPEGIEMTFLLPKSFARSQDDEFNILITSNMVPMQKDFITEVWNPIASQVRSIASGRDGVSVVAGPVYDTNRDGLRDTYKSVALWTNDWVGRTPVPTHFFIVITICNDPDTDIFVCEAEDFLVTAYIFPHTEGIRTCDETIQDYMKTYQATVYEVEAITGLYFFSEIEEDAQVQENELKHLIAMKMSRKPFS